MQASNRILFNTIAMYSKTIVNILVGLLTTRFVLEALGMKDFGIWGVVGSVVGLLDFFNATMARATQRFLSFHREQEDISSVFSISIIIHIVTAIIFAILLEIGGFFFLDILNIAPERREMMYLVFHCVVAITFFSIVAIPYQALINAKEDMFYMAVFSVVEAFVKLGIALLLFVSSYDRLGTYAVAMMVLAIFMRIIQGVFCKIHYTKINFSYKTINKELAYKMLTFSGWNFFENFGAILRLKCLPILMNIFFGTAMNAIYSLAGQVAAQINVFSAALWQASAPQIVSGMANKSKERSKMLAVSSSKLQLFIVSLVAIPLILNIDYILEIWLNQVPEYLSVFCCLAIINEMVICGTTGLHSLIMGRGFIRGFMVISGALNLIMLLIAYILLKTGGTPYSIYIGVLIGFVLYNISRIYFAHRHASLAVIPYLKEISKVTLTVIFTFICVYLFIRYPLSVIHSKLAMLLITTTLSFAMMNFGFWFTLSAKEREFIKGLKNSFSKKETKNERRTEELHL